MKKEIIPTWEMVESCESTTVYYLPRTGEVKETSGFRLNNSELSDLFETGVSGAITYDTWLEEDDDVLHFCSEMVIGDRLVYRIFRIRIVYDSTEDGRRYCKLSTPREIRRYVFGREGIMIEKSDHTMKEGAPDTVDSYDIYDTLFDADAIYYDSLMKEFINDVNIPHKEEIIGSL